MSISRWIAAGLGLAAVGGAVAFAQYRDIEKPAHDVLMTDGDFELRQYAPMIVAEVVHTGSRERASSAGFQRLAAYIFAKDRPGSGPNADESITMTSPVMQNRVGPDEKIAMTAPVLQDTTAGNEWRTRFVMPSEYSMADLPEPPSDITLNEVPRRRVAALRFSGNPSEADLIVMETRLEDWIEEQGLTAKGGVEYAFYDAPMVPGPLRRNEVMIEVE
jgi:DNA gyrase inhibitor GyrI